MVSADLWVLGTYSGLDQLDAYEALSQHGDDDDAMDLAAKILGQSNKDEWTSDTIRSISNRVAAQIPDDILRRTEHQIVTSWSSLPAAPPNVQCLDLVYAMLGSPGYTMSPAVCSIWSQSHMSYQRLWGLIARCSGHAMIGPSLRVLMSGRTGLGYSSHYGIAMRTQGYGVRSVTEYPVLSDLIGKVCIDDELIIYSESESNELSQGDKSTDGIGKTWVQNSRHPESRLEWDEPEFMFDPHPQLYSTIGEAVTYAALRSYEVTGL